MPGKHRLRRKPFFADGNPTVGTDRPYFVDLINLFSGAMGRYDRIVREMGSITCGGEGSEEGGHVTHCD